MESVASLELKNNFSTSQKFLRSIEKYCEVEKLNELLFSEHESVDNDYKLHLGEIVELKQQESRRDDDSFPADSRAFGYR